MKEHAQYSVAGTEIKKLSTDLGIEKVMAVLSKAPEEPTVINEKLAEMGVPLLGTIPFDTKPIVQF